MFNCNQHSDVIVRLWTVACRTRRPRPPSNLPSFIETLKRKRWARHYYPDAYRCWRGPVGKFVTWVLATLAPSLLPHPPLRSIFRASSFSVPQIFKALFHYNYYDDSGNQVVGTSLNQCISMPRNPMVTQPEQHRLQVKSNRLATLCTPHMLST
jgi:hypothetical protein